MSPGERALVARCRTEVTEALTARARADEGTGRPRLPEEDQRAFGRALIAEVLDRAAADALAQGAQVLSPLQEQAVAKAAMDAVFGLAGFQPLVDDDSIENINVNGAERVFVRYADGRREQLAPVAESDAELVELVRTLAARAGLGERRFDLGCPRLSLQLPDGSRLFAVMAVTGRPAVSIRRHRFAKLTCDDLVGLGTIDLALREMLGAAVRARKNILVVGGTGSGKTTTLRALCAEIPPAERLVTIEDSLELALDRDADAHPDVVAMEAREPNVEGEGEITQAELVRWALRMSPDRVLVGEIRGAEVVPMCNAMSQGNDGSMATLHASSSQAAFAKLAAYAIQAPEHLSMEATALLVATAVDLVVHLGADAAGRRVVSSVREVIDAEGPMVISNEVFRPGPDARAVPGAPLRAETTEALAAAGFDAGLLERRGGWWDR